MQKNTYGAIHLDAVHGYRLDGDNVELNAQLVLGDGVSLTHWKLQLWAKDVFASGSSAGVKVAEVNLDTAEVNGRVARLDTRLAATLPPTGRYYDMALVLAANDADGPADVANYSERQWITGPFLQGAVGYAVNDGRVTVTVEQVCNPRSDGNVSGTLALELWATQEPYAGGAVSGHQLSGVVLGTLAGQASRPDVVADLAFVAPPVGTWQIVLMLREWTAAGYVTRDYRTFDASYRVPATAVEPRAAEVAAAMSAVEALSLVEAAVQPTTSGPAPAPAPAPTQAPAKPQVVTSTTAAPSPSDNRVSVQTASVEELTKVKGLTKKVAQEIVRARPYKSLDELTRVKGIGEKTLRAVRHAIKL